MVRREAIPKNEKLTPEYAYKLMVDSFLLSQGDFIPFQESLLQLVFKRHPEWVIEGEVKTKEYRAVEARLKDRETIRGIHMYLNKPRALGTRDHPRTLSKPPTLEEVTEFWLKAVDVFLKLLCGDGGEYRGSEVPDKKKFFGYFIERDFRFYTNIGGMVYHSRDESFIVDYLLEGSERKKLLTQEFRDICKLIASARFTKAELEEMRFELGFIQEGINKLPDPKKRIDIRSFLLR